MHPDNGVVDAEILRRIDERLEEVYLSNRDAHDAERDVESYYSSERGYYQPDADAPERRHFAISMVSVDGDVHVAGDHDLPFALQSISKVFVYGSALSELGREEVLRRVGVKPSADSFTTLGFDERNNRPFNPMINGGALATTDMVLGSSFDESFDRILDALRRYAGNPSLTASEDIYAAEVRGADRNRATAYLMRSNGMLQNDVERTLALYLRQCSVKVTCRDLGIMAATLANGCRNPVTSEQVLPRARVRDMLSVMYTCGMYDFAGEWAYDIGIPAKSGVSGGVMAVVPGKMGIAVYSPGLDHYGNSVRGTRVCAELSGRMGLHVFATEAEDSVLGPAEPDQGEAPPPP